MEKAEDLKKTSLKTEDLLLYRKTWQVCCYGTIFVCTVLALEFTNTFPPFRPVRIIIVCHWTELAQWFEIRRAGGYCGCLTSNGCSATHSFASSVNIS